MGALKIDNLVQFPGENLRHADRAKPRMRRLLCPVCGFPSVTSRGRQMHRLRMHGANSFADRNWEIFYLHTDKQNPTTIDTLAQRYGLSEATIKRIVWRGMAWPGIYNLEEELR